MRRMWKVPTVNFSRPDKRYEWAILPQGMANSLAFCQQYLYSILSPYFDKDNTLLYVYMDDLIIGHLEESGIALWITTIVDILQKHGFNIAPNKKQKVPPFHILGFQLTLIQAKVNGPPNNLSWASYFIEITKDTGGNELGKVLVTCRDWETRCVIWSPKREATL